MVFFNTDPTGAVAEMERGSRERDAERRAALPESRFAVATTNRLIRAVWPAAGVLAIIVGIAIGEIFVALAAATIVVAGAAAHFWTRWSLERFTASVSISQTHAFVGEQIELRLRIENKKILPLPGLRARVVLPDVLEPSDERFDPQAGSPPFTGVVGRSAAVRWYERITWHWRIPLRARGYYRLAPIELRSTDVFGVFARERAQPPERSLWVYPEIVPLPDIPLPQLRPHGDRRGGQRLFEDVTRLRTIRDYRPGDPLKRIDWKSTARRQELQSRVYDPSSDLVAAVALNVSTLPVAWEGFYADIFERAVIAAGSLAAAHDARRIPVGLIANCTYPGRDAAIRVPPSRAPGQMTRILEALAMADVYTLVPIGRMLAEESRWLPYGSTIALVTAVVTPALESSLARLHRRGIDTAVFYVGLGDAPALAGGAEVHDIRDALAGIHFEQLPGSENWIRSDLRRDVRNGPAPEPDAPPVDLPRFGAANGAGDAPDPDRGPEPAASAPTDNPWARPRGGEDR